MPSVKIKARHKCTGDTQFSKGAFSDKSIIILIIKQKRKQREPETHSVNNACTSKSFSRSFGPVLYHPTTCSLAETKTSLLLALNENVEMQNDW